MKQVKIFIASLLLVYLLFSLVIAILNQDIIRAIILVIGLVIIGIAIFIFKNKSKKLEEVGE